ncbi:MAG: ATP-binding protein [Erysipelotrichaceae bacterium]
MKSIQESLPDLLKSNQLSSPQNYQEVEVQRYNQEEGTLKGKDCQHCKNRGYIMILEEGYTALKKCECQKARQSKVIIEKSGLKKLIQEYTMEAYQDDEPWQQTIKSTAKFFIESPETHWFFIGGQVGSGKTHICTAIVNELMNQGKEALYMLWRDEIVKLKAKSMEGPEYQKTIQAYKTIKVLYIDDLFKTEKGKFPTTADINIAFEILNARYLDKSIITIISCEKIIKQLAEIDEATASRIYQMTKGFCLELNQNPKMNMRLRERKTYE